MGGGKSSAPDPYAAAESIYNQYLQETQPLINNYLYPLLNQQMGIYQTAQQVAQNQLQNSLNNINSTIPMFYTLANSVPSILHPSIVGKGVASSSSNKNTGGKNG